MLQLPVTNDPAQVFSTTLGDQAYEFELVWNERAEKWSITVRDDFTKADIITGAAVVLGQDIFAAANLTNGILMPYDETRSSREATLDSMGASFNIYWMSTDEALASYANIQDVLQ